MERDKRSASFFEEHSLLFIIFMMGCVLLNNLVTEAVTEPFYNNITVYYLLAAACNFLTAVIPIFFMVKWNLTQRTEPRNVLAGFLTGIPCLILMAENLAPLSLINPMLFQVQWKSVSAIILAYLGVGVMEEAGCRGVLLPLLCRKWSMRKNGYVKAAVASSAIFACTHLAWIANALIFQGKVSLAECLGRLYQMYYAFCFGMLCAGIVLYARSIFPVIIWHALIDISAFIDRGILPEVTYNYYYGDSRIGLDTVLIRLGVLKRSGGAYLCLLAGIDAILLITGSILVYKSQKKT